MKHLLSYLLLVATIPHVGAWSPPLLRRDGAMPQRRQFCAPPTPNVDQEKVFPLPLPERKWLIPTVSKLFADICNTNRQNEFWNCNAQLATYASDSANTHCSGAWAVYNSCLVARNYNDQLCLDEKLGSSNCYDYTLQTYAFCFCYYQLPDDLHLCANLVLEIHRPLIGPAVAVTTTTCAPSIAALLTAPIVPTSATATFSYSGLGGFTGNLPTLSSISLPALASPSPSPPSLNTPNPLSNPSLLTQANPLASTPLPPGSGSRITLTLLSTYSATFTATLTVQGGVRVLSTYASLITSTLIGVQGGTGSNDAPCTATITSVLRREGL
ncbi:hypothetical protein MMC22_010573 [Lobaria immixta]|nr:hypothetical protein [Lobaria immixta]